MCSRVKIRLRSHIYGCHHDTFALKQMLRHARQSSFCLRNLRAPLAACVATASYKCTISVIVLPNERDTTKLLFASTLSSIAKQTMPRNSCTVLKPLIVIFLRTHASGAYSECARCSNIMRNQHPSISPANTPYFCHRNFF